jgi:hypothetical protein
MSREPTQREEGIEVGRRDIVHDRFILAFVFVSSSPSAIYPVAVLRIHVIMYSTQSHQ